MLKYFKPLYGLGCLAARSLDIKPMLPVPEILYIRDLEDATYLSQRLDPVKHVVVYSPDSEPVVCSEMKICKRKVEGLRVPYFKVRRAFWHMYQDHAKDDYSKNLLQSLENKIDEERERKASDDSINLDRARSWAKGASVDNSTEEYLRMEVRSQFKYLEHFITELMQNSDGATLDKEAGRIDCIIDRENRTVKVIDTGYGMDRQVFEDHYLKLYSSLNELLANEGRFGVGAYSAYILGHEYVKVDTLPEGKTSKDGLSVILDESNSILPLPDGSKYGPSTRSVPGTTIEIKLKEDSPIDLDKVLDILQSECCYIKTPIYITDENRTYKINKELVPKARSGLIAFDEDGFQGHILAVSGMGELELLSYRIGGYMSIPMRGISGAINCTAFEKGISRDKITNQDLVKSVVDYVSSKAIELRESSQLDISAYSLETRIADYMGFVGERLWQPDGSPNTGWLNSHKADMLKIYPRVGNGIRYENMFMSRLMTFPSRLLSSISENTKKNSKGNFLSDVIAGCRSKNSRLSQFALYYGLSSGVFLTSTSRILKDHYILTDSMLLGYILPYVGWAAELCLREAENYIVEAIAGFAVRNIYKRSITSSKNDSSQQISYVEPGKYGTNKPNEIDPETTQDLTNLIAVSKIFADTPYTKIINSADLGPDDPPLQFYKDSIAVNPHASLDPDLLKIWIAARSADSKSIDIVLSKMGVDV